MASELKHYGIPRRSGRYPWGSGDDPYQSSRGFVGYANQLKKDGFSERANIIIDENGKIIFIKIYPIKEVPDLNEIFDFLNNI